MRAEKVVTDKNFVKGIMKKLPVVFFTNFSSEEIKSEIYLCIYKAQDSFNPNKGNLHNYVYRIVLWFLFINRNGMLGLEVIY